SGRAARCHPGGYHRAVRRQCRLHLRCPSCRPGGGSSDARWTSGGPSLPGRSRRPMRQQLLQQHWRTTLRGLPQRRGFRHRRDHV
ncbi:unnamed protein product, partial [Ectocarpus sp. 12 AP-2014]